MKQIFNKCRIHRIAAVVLAAAISLCQLSGSMSLSNLSSASPLQSIAFSEGAKQNSVSAVKKISLNYKISSKKVKPVKISANTAAVKQTIQKSSAGTGYTYVSQRSGYQSLTTQSEKILYNFIGDSAYQVADQQVSGYYPTGEIFLPYKMTEAQIRTTIIAYTNDNPQIFWLANAFSYSIQSGGTILQPYSYLPEIECNSAIDTFSSKVKSVVQSIPSGLSEFDREEYLFNYLVQNCTYDTEAATNTGKWQSFSAYGALTGGQAVCEGYSRAMQLLCSYAGLQCALIRGTSDGVGHMWNAVRINGKWYHLDVTWGDNSFPVYNYFNVTDKVISQSRSVAPRISSLTVQQINSGNVQSNLYLPVCNSTSANYYIVKGIKIKDLKSPSESAIISSITSKMQNGVESISFYVDPNSNYTSVVNSLLTNSPNKMSFYLAKAEQISGKTVGEVSYLLDTANRGFTLYITY